jgi:Predicted metal-dependent membrane protease
MTDSTKPPFFARIGFLRLVLFFVLLALADFGPQLILQSFIRPHLPDALRPAVFLASAIAIGAFVIWIYRLLVRWLEKREAPEINSKPRAFAIGAAMAVALFAAIYAIFFAIGAARFNGINPAPHLLAILTMVILSGIGEELVFRGAVYRIVEDMFGSAAALIFSGALFGFLHWHNPGATFFSGFAIAIEAGVLLGAAYALTRNLWLPIGIHMGWNFAEGGIFGASVSGMKSNQGLLDIPLSGSNLVTGGAFGPEASVVVAVICTAAGIAFVWLAIKRGRWVPFRSRLMLD